MKKERKKKKHDLQYSFLTQQFRQQYSITHVFYKFVKCRSYFSKQKFKLKIVGHLFVVQLKKAKITLSVTCFCIKYSNRQHLNWKVDTQHESPSEIEK